MTDIERYIKEMMEKAAKTDKSDDAMRFSQAACNAFAALATLDHVKRANAMGEAGPIGTGGTA